MATVNLNVATKEQLAEMEEVGPVLAERIRQYRDESGEFASVEELTEVRGIGDKKFNRIKKKNDILLVDREKAEKNLIAGKKELETSGLGGMREERDLCPALPSCPFYEASYCQNDYDECARYKIITSPLNEDEYLPGSLLPGDHEKADEILTNNL
jgi:competence ComEA-like helix-hairpin-helix protein